MKLYSVAFRAAELKQIFIMELVKRAQFRRRRRCRGFDINVTRRSFEFMNHSRFHKAQLGTAGLFFGHVQLEEDTNVKLFLPHRET